jgi:hypothetical protein
VIDEAAWPGLEATLSSEKLTGLALASADAGAIAIPDERAESLLERHRRAMAWCLLVEERLLELDDRFRRAGIDYAVLKGPAVAHTAYPDPALRGFGDLDVLVRGRSFHDACLLLEEMGFRRRVPEPRPGFDERFGKAATHKSREDAMEIDLHRTLVLGPFGLWIEPEAMLDRSVSFELAGRKIPRLDDTDTLLSVAMHAVLGWPSHLLPLRDVLQVAARADVDWPALGRRAAGWRLSAVLLHAFVTAASTLGAEPVEDAAVLARIPVRRGEVRALRSYVSERRRVGGTALSTLRAIRGWRSKVAYARALAFPRREFMDDRYRVGPKASYGRRLLMPGRWAWRRLAAVRAREP